MLNNTIEKYLDETAIGRPTPSGGSAAALMGSLAASLLLKTCNITIKKKKGNNGTHNIHKEANLLKAQLTYLIEEDARAYNEVIIANKTKDNDKIQQALKYATEVPMKITELSCKVRKLSSRAKSICYEKTLVEILAVEVFSNAAMKAAILYVQENLKEITDKKFVKEYTNKWKQYGLTIR